MLPPPAGQITAAQAARLPNREPPRRRSHRGRRTTRTSKSEFPRRLRLLILERDAWTCQLCGRSLTPLPGRPDSGIAGHIVPRWAGGQAIPSNARAECAECSTKGGAMERLAAGGRPWRPRTARDDQVPRIW